MAVATVVDISSESSKRLKDRAGKSGVSNVTESAQSERVIDILAEAPTSFEDAIASGLEKARDTVGNIKGAWVRKQTVKVKDGRITAYCAEIRVTFDPH